MVGGGHAFELYSALGRDTKDLDLFVRPADVKLILAQLAAAGYKTDLSFPHWLGKIFCAQHFIDVILSSGNGVRTVDDGWFEHSVAGEFLDQCGVTWMPPSIEWFGQLPAMRRRNRSQPEIEMKR